jgi:hypothetical protein
MQRAVRTLAHTAIWATLFDEGFPYLKKAIQLEKARAHYALAVIYSKRGEANKAVVPTDRSVVRAVPRT